MGNQQGILEKRKEETMSVLNYHLVIGPMREDEFLFFYKVCFGQAFSLEGTGMNSIRELMREMGDAVDISTCEGREVYCLKSRKRSFAMPPRKGDSPTTRSNESNLVDNSAGGDENPELIEKNIQAFREIVATLLVNTKEPEVSHSDFETLYSDWTGIILTEEVLEVKYGCSKLENMMKSRLSDIVETIETGDEIAYRLKSSTLSSTTKFPISSSSPLSTDFSWSTLSTDFSWSTESNAQMRRQEIEENIAEFRRNAVVVLRSFKAGATEDEFASDYSDWFQVNLTEDVLQSKYGYVRLDLLMEGELSDILEIQRSGSAISYSLKGSEPFAGSAIGTPAVTAGVQEAVEIGDDGIDASVKKIAPASQQPQTATANSSTSATEASGSASSIEEGSGKSKASNKREMIEEFRRNVVAVFETCTNPIEGSQFITLYEKITGSALTKDVVQEKYGYSKLIDLMTAELSDVVHVLKVGTAIMYELKESAPPVSNCLCIEAKGPPSDDVTLHPSITSSRDSSTLIPTAATAAASTSASSIREGRTNDGEEDFEEFRRNAIAALQSQDEPMDASRFFAMYFKTTGVQLTKAMIKSKFGFSKLNYLMRLLSDIVEITTKSTMTFYALRQTSTTSSSSSSRSQEQATTVPSTNATADKSKAALLEVSPSAAAPGTGGGGGASSGGIAACTGSSSSAGIQSNLSIVESMRDKIRTIIINNNGAVEVSEFIPRYKETTGEELRLSAYGVSTLIQLVEKMFEGCSGDDAVVVDRSGSKTMLVMKNRQPTRCGGVPLPTTGPTAAEVVVASEKNIDSTGIGNPSSSSSDELEELRRNVVAVLKTCTNPVEGSVFVAAYKRMTGSALTKDIVRQKYGYRCPYLLIEAKLGDLVDVIITAVGISYRLKSAALSDPAISPPVSTESSCIEICPSTDNTAATALSTAIDQRDKTNEESERRSSIEEFCRNVIAVLQIQNEPMYISRFVAAYFKATGVQLTNVMIKSKFGFSTLKSLMKSLSDTVEMSTTPTGLCYALKQTTTSSSRSQEQATTVPSTNATADKSKAALLEVSPSAAAPGTGGGGGASSGVIAACVGSTLSAGDQSNLGIVESMRDKIRTVIINNNGAVEVSEFIPRYKETTGEELRLSAFGVSTLIQLVEKMFEGCSGDDAVVVDRSGSKMMLVMKNRQPTRGGGVPLPTTGPTAAEVVVASEKNIDSTGIGNPSSSSSDELEDLRRDVVAVLRTCKQPVDAGEFISIFERMTGSAMTKDFVWTKYGYSKLIDLMRAELSDIVDISDVKSYTFKLSLKPSSMQTNTSPSSTTTTTASLMKKADKIEELRRNVTAALKGCTAPLEVNQFIKRYFDLTGIKLTSDVVKQKYGYTQLHLLMESEMSDIVDVKLTKSGITYQLKSETPTGSTLSLLAPTVNSLSTSSSNISAQTKNAAATSSSALLADGGYKMNDSNGGNSRIEEFRRNAISVLHCCKQPVDAGDFISAFEKMTGSALTKDIIKKKHHHSKLIDLMRAELSDIVDISDVKSYTFSLSLKPSMQINTLPSSTTTTSAAAASTSCVNSQGSMRNKIRTVIINNNGAVEVSEFIPRYKETTGEELQLSPSTLIQLVEKMFEGCSGDDTVVVDRSGSKTMLVMKKHQASQSSTLPPPPPLHSIAPPPALTKPHRQLRRNIRHILDLASGKLEIRMFLMMYRHTFDVVLDPSEYGFRKLGDMFRWMGDMVEVKKEGSHVFLYLNPSAPTEEDDDEEEEICSSEYGEEPTQSAMEELCSNVRSILAQEATREIEASELLGKYFLLFGKKLCPEEYGFSRWSEFVGCMGEMVCVKQRRNVNNNNNNNSKEEEGEWYLVFH